MNYVQFDSFPGVGSFEQLILNGSRNLGVPDIPSYYIISETIWKWIYPTSGYKYII